MIRAYLLPILAVIGFGFGIRTVIVGQRTIAAAAPLITPPTVPFQKFVAGSGIIEASSENISIATPVSGVVKEVAVSVGQHVKKGDLLFSLDDRELLARREIRSAAVEVAEAEFKSTAEQLQLWEKVTDRRAISEEELIKRRYAVSSARAALLQARAELNAVQTDLDRLMIRSPIDGEVLQVKVRAGEFAPAQLLAAPLVLLGSTSELHIRVDVDENDAWRVKPKMKAKAFLRGNPSISVDLSFVRFEPYVVPKRSLTGDSSERVDTRVLQILYKYNPKQFEAFVGQLVDVFIETTDNG